MSFRNWLRGSAVIALGVSVAVGAHAALTTQSSNIGNNPVQICVGSTGGGTPALSACSVIVDASGADATGAAGTGITQPTGGGGMLGWLSGIYNRVSGTAAGTSATTAMAIQGVTNGVPQAVTQTARPFLVSAGALQAGGAIVTTAGTYAANTVIGGPLVFPSAVAVLNGAADFYSMNFQFKTAGIAPSLAVEFSCQPFVGTYTDTGVFNLASGDAIDMRVVSDPFWLAAGTGGTYGTTLDTSRAVRNCAGSTNVYALVVTTGALTLGSTSDLTISLRDAPK